MSPMGNYRGLADEIVDMARKRIEDSPMMQHEKDLVYWRLRDLFDKLPVQGKRGI